MATPATTREDAIVVGLGAMGSAVTAELARRGARVVGIDRFHPPHDRGSTHGDTRITRLAIGEGPEYVPLVRRSHELWRELERATGSSLLHQVGGLVIGDRDDPFLAQTRATALQYGIDHEDLTGDELAARFPMFTVDPGTEAYLEAEAGYLRPEAGVSAQLTVARRAGARLRLGETVRSWSSDASGVTVVTDGGTLHAAELVLCAGAWVTRLVPALASLFAVYPQHLHWFGVREGYPQLREMPVFIWQMDGRSNPFTHLTGGFYGFPAIDGADGGVKIATERYDAAIDPDAPPGPEAGTAAAAALRRDWLGGRFPWIGEQPLRTVSCLYTNTRGSRFIIGPLPAHPHVTLVAACSGHGFKHSPAIGEAVAQTLAEGSSRIDLAPFAPPD